MLKACKSALDNGCVMKRVPLGVGYLEIGDWGLASGRWQVQIALSPCHPVTLSPHHLVTLSQIPAAGIILTNLHTKTH
jgi:hypothetical protein